MNSTRKLSLLFLSFICLNGLVKAQNQIVNTSNDELISDLVERHKRNGLMKQTTAGYRIQIYFGSERSKAAEIKTDFFNNFSNTPSYLLYQQPNFKVRVGDFKTRMEAAAFLESIKEFYTTSFIVPDEIKLPKRDLNNASKGNQGSQGNSLGNNSSASKTPISANLTGRNIRILPQLNEQYQEEGRIVLDISVDTKGNVVLAEGPARGSTTTNTSLLQKAKEIAYKTKFSESEVPAENEVTFQKGTISITFTID
jgi:hypothetical protein